MVIDDIKCVFVHIPKTAGTSIEQVLYPPLSRKRVVISGMSDTNLFAGWNEEHKIWMQHATMQQINDLYEKDVSEYFKFSFVRNPYERAISDWKFLRRKSHKKWRSKTFLKYLNREGYFKRILSNRKDKSTRIDHTYPQYDFIYDDNGKCLVDFIGKTENLQEDFNIICDKLGIPRQKLPHEKKGKHKHYTEYYDDESREIVAEKYAKDIEYFGYEFGE
jgi:hypothetical protein